MHRRPGRLAAAESKMAALTAPASPLVASGATEPPDPTPREPFWPRSLRGWIAAATTVLVAICAVVTVALLTVLRS